MNAPAFHPLANLFPLIEGEAFSELVADIAARGQEDAIVLHQGMILDGRNRFRACEAAGLAPRFTIFGLSGEPTPRMIDAALAGRALSDDEMRWTPIDLGDVPADFTVAGVPGADALGYVISKNLRRRHLDVSQRSLVAARLATMRQGERTDLSEPSANLQKVSREDAAEILNVSERSVASAADVLEHGASELVDAVERGEIAVSVAADLSTLPLDEQRRAIETADKRAIGQVVKAVRAEKQQEKRERREAREQQLGERQRTLPDKRYGVIYADPEWRFEPFSRETGMDRAADNHYPTSELNDIVLRPVGDIAAKDCALFLWATAPMLLSAIRVLQNWGFTYKTHWIWSKDRIGTGYWNRNKHELLLLATRGDVPAPAMGDQWDSVIEAAVGEHSAKPEIFAEMIEAHFPTLPKIELNARRARPGWEVWGLEAPATDEIPAGSPVPEAGLPEPTAVIAAAPAQPRPNAGPEGTHRPQPERRPHPSAVASADGPFAIDEVGEWGLLRAIDDGEEVSGPGVEFLISEGLAKRDGKALKTTMLGGLRRMTLTRLINAPPEKREAMRQALQQMGSAE